MLRIELPSNFSNPKKVSLEADSGGGHWNECGHGAVSAVDDPFSEKFSCSLHEHGHRESNRETFKVGGKVLLIFDF